MIMVTVEKMVLILLIDTVQCGVMRCSVLSDHISGHRHTFFDLCGTCYVITGEQGLIFYWRLRRRGVLQGLEICFRCSGRRFLILPASPGALISTTRHCVSTWYQKHIHLYLPRLSFRCKSQ